MKGDISGPYPTVMVKPGSVFLSYETLCIRLWPELSY